VVQLDPASGYIIQTVLTLESLTKLAEIPKEDQEAVKNDVKNFYDGRPTITIGSVVGGKQ
jgi:hypothetical protein